MMSVDADQLSTMISHAIAPAFLLSAIAALVSILINRMADVTERIRTLNQISESDAERAWLKADTARLQKRERLLNSALHMGVIGGIGITCLLLLGFVVAFFGYRHEPGAALLFVVALCFLLASLFRFLQDVRLSLSEHDHHR
ncbi:DUF2721 domain-containing protein [Rhizobium sp. BK251]|uniref:DUF2721 domain-containing protein n=1 Tax=Rhizobium sp. BK251 TaxID=2512125 RepID=UPI0010E18E57|nr:DUF2721 domain-containing protein [Rhizobium sp. BK251]TCL71359.1 uncharacterized protein DUF2721 [Rhizobium sp. BK251]